MVYNTRTNRVGGFRVAAATTAVVGVAAVSLATPAYASTPTRHSPNTAGYAATDSSPVTSFAGSLNVPTVTCPSTGTVAINANVTIVDSVSGDGVGIGWQIVCTTGTESISPAEAAVFNQTGVLSLGEVGIAGGDALSLSMTDKAGNYTAKVTDKTNQQAASASAPLPVSLTGITVETTFHNGGSGNISPIPSFSPITYGGMKFNGATLSTLSPTRFLMYDGTVLQVNTTQITTGGSFSTDFVHS